MSTILSTLISRMNAYTPINNKDEVLKVNAVDQALREHRMNMSPPWTLKDSTLRVFKDVLMYPLPSDYADMAILDTDKQNVPFGQRPRYVFTTLKDFLEDPTPRNVIAEVWNAGTRFIGVRNKTDGNMTSETLDNASDASDWAGSGDAGTPVLDEVNFVTGNSSIRVPVTNSSNVATIVNTFQNSITDTSYKRKYFFAWVYLDAVPTSITLRLRKTASIYLEKTGITTQFSGAALVADQWNLVAMDLNLATATGAVDGTFASAVYILNGAATGDYYFDASYMRGWVIQDFWYYSVYNVLDGSTYQDFFAPDGATYNPTALLLGDTVWHDMIMYAACTYLLTDEKEEAILQKVNASYNKAKELFEARYADLSPRPITNVFRFGTDYREEMYPDGINTI